MVDFNNEATIAAPAVDIKRILILERNNYVQDAIEAYKQQQYAGVNTEDHVVRARVYTLFLEVRAGIARHFKTDEDFNQLKDYVNSTDINEVLQAYEIINNWPDHIGLTKIDIKQKLGGNMAERNKAQGWKS